MIKRIRHWVLVQVACFMLKLQWKLQGKDGKEEQRKLINDLFLLAVTSFVVALNLLTPGYVCCYPA